MKIRRREYETHNCIAYLVNRMKYQEDETAKLTCKLIKQEENFHRENISQKQEIAHFMQMVSNIQAQNTELNNENRLLNEQIAQRNDVVKVQQENVPKVGENSTIAS